MGLSFIFILFGVSEFEIPKV